jgi:hypothetical protein
MLPVSAYAKMMPSHPGRHHEEKHDACHARRTRQCYPRPVCGRRGQGQAQDLGRVHRGSNVHSLVLTDVASGWTEAAPIVVREATLVVETLERIRVSLPFALQAVDVDNGSEFMNDKLIEYLPESRNRTHPIPPIP